MGKNFKLENIENRILGVLRKHIRELVTLQRRKFKILSKEQIIHGAYKGGSEALMHLRWVDRKEIQLLEEMTSELRKLTATLEQEMYNELTV